MAPPIKRNRKNGYWGFTNKTCNKLGGNCYWEGATPKVNIPLYWSCGLSKNIGYWINDIQNAPKGWTWEKVWTMISLLSLLIGVKQTMNHNFHLIQSCRKGISHVCKQRSFLKKTQVCSRGSHKHEEILIHILVVSKTMLYFVTPKNETSWKLRDETLFKICWK